MEYPISFYIKTSNDAFVSTIDPLPTHNISRASNYVAFNEHELNTTLDAISQMKGRNDLYPVLITQELSTYILYNKKTHKNIIILKFILAIFLLIFSFTTIIFFIILINK